MVREEGIGWVVDPGDVKRTVELILSAKQNRSLLFEMGLRGRLAAEQRYSSELILGKFDIAIADLT